jgi:hypothetical protein
MSSISLALPNSCTESCTEEHDMANRVIKIIFMIFMLNTVSNFKIFVKVLGLA